MLTTVPAIYWLALQQPDFADDRHLLGARRSATAARRSPRTWCTGIQAAFPTARVGNGFGLTETSSVSTYLPHEYAAEHADSVGFPAPVVDVRLDDPDPETGVGELLIRGPNVVAGYWGKPEQTAETFVDGWLHTGDLARIDDDGLVYDRRPQEGHDQPRRRERVLRRGGERARRAPRASARSPWSACPTR